MVINLIKCCIFSTVIIKFKDREVKGLLPFILLFLNRHMLL